jgi:class 3 adenylate cyclase
MGEHDEAVEGATVSAGGSGAAYEALRDVLKAISRSPGDLDSVLDVIVRHLTQLCNADIGMVYLPLDEGHYLGSAGYAMRPEHLDYERAHPTPITPGTLIGRVVLSGDVVQIEDTATDPSYTWSEGRRVGGYRTMLGMPISKDSQPIGAVGLANFDVRLFTPEQIELVRTFADQAAIVIDNVRLLSTIERQREELARFVPSPVADLITRPDGRQLLDGHRREVTAVSVDLRGFTAFAEAAEPEEVMTALRAYHEAMGKQIVAHSATLEHFAGDGLMIFLNDPVEVPDHTLAAVRMALGMRAAFEPLAASWRRQGFELGMGIGISVGYASLGRVGFEGYYGYSIIGSVANLAARLCSIAKDGQIVLSERAYSRVEGEVQGTSIGAIELKGFRRPVVAYSV